MDVVWTRYWSHSRNWSDREGYSLVSTFNSYGLPLGLRIKSSQNPFGEKLLSSDEEESKTLSVHGQDKPNTDKSTRVRHTQVPYPQAKRGYNGRGDPGDDSVDHV